MKQCINRGFTLVELLLVIAVLSIIAALGIMSYRRYFETSRLDKVAIGMQHVLEAAMAYYIDNDATWPNPRNCDASEPQQDSFVTKYLPNGNYVSYFGTDYCWHDAGAGTVPEQHRLFWVALKIPGMAPDNALIAERLASRLPNAVATSDPTSSNESAPPSCENDLCFVRAEITVPGGGSVSGTVVAATGHCQAGQTIPSGTGSCAPLSNLNVSAGANSYTSAYTITFKACPAGKHPILTISPNFISMPRTRNGLPIVRVEAYGLYDDQSNCSTTAVNEKQTCSAAVLVTDCKPNGRDDCYEQNISADGGTVGATYIINCVENQNQVRGWVNG